MKLSKVIFGVDDSYFLEFWPLQSKICKEILGLEPVLFYISEEESDFYHDGNGLVKKIKKVGNKNTGLLACIVRLFGTKYFPDEVCITGDLDMLMINKEYFINQVEKFDENSLVIYTSDAYDLNRPEAQQLFENQPFPFKQEMYNYPYYAAKGDTFTKVIDNLCSFEEFVYRHETYKPGYNFMWMIDEFYFSDCVNNKEHGVEVHKLKRGYTTPWMASRRIDRHNFPVKLQWQNEIDMQNKYGIYDKQKLIDGYYIDVNCCRPYSNYKKEIDELVNIVMERKNTKKLIIEERTELCDIMDKHGSDKASKPTWVDYLGHNYTRYYSQLFEEIRHDNIKIFELGLGTNNVNIPSNMGSLCTPGASLRGWKEYFTNGEIYGADIDKKILFNDERIKTFYCDQTNNDDIQKMWGSINQNFDIIIDDGLHQFDANLNFLKNSIHLLNVNGFYIVEDVINNELELWKNEIENLKKSYENYNFSIIELQWTHSDNNLIVIKKISDTKKDIEKENNIINLETYDKKTGKFYFKFLKNEEGIIKVKISHRNLTVYKTEFLIKPNLDVVYYVGMNQDCVEYPDKLQLDIEFKNQVQLLQVDNRERLVKLPDIDLMNTDPNDECYFTYCEVFDREVYDGEIVKVEKNDIVVDIGANYGFFAKYAELKGVKKIYCFEPSIKIFEYLKKNLQNNTKIILDNSAISNYNGVANFSDSFVSAGSRFDDNGYEVKVKDINDVILNEIPYQIDYLKIDCEGAEYEIFDSINGSSLAKVKKIAVEYHDEKSRNTIIEKLESYNFIINDDKNSIIFSSNPLLIEKKKKIALINTFCNNQEKIDMLESLIKNIKNEGVDVLCLSPIKLPESTVKLCDFFFYTKENPIIPWILRQHLHWHIFQIHGNRITTFQRGFDDYGWAGLYQVKKLAQIALTFDYDIFYHTIYDVEFNDTFVDALSKNEVNYVHNLNTGFGPTFHLMVLDKEMLRKIENQILYETYIINNENVEAELRKWVDLFDIKVSNLPVIEKKSYWDEVDLYNYSPFEEIKFFISKNNEMDIWLGSNNPYLQTLSGNLRIVFYHTNLSEITISINHTNHNVEIRNWEIVEFPISSSKVEEISFKFGDKFLDFTSQYKNIVMNQIYYNHNN
jgi:FkbM family methyltransferase